MKKVNRDPFSSGTEHMRFEEYNCDKCVKSSEPIEGGLRYTNSDKDNMPRCGVQRDIVIRMFGDTPINQRTIRICEEFTLHGVLCPYLKTEWPKRKRKRMMKGQLALGL